MLQRHIQRDAAALRAGHQCRRLVASQGIHHRQQIRDGRMRFRFRTRLAESTAVVSDGLMRRAHHFDLRPPHPAIANRRVQEDDGLARADNFGG
ncbi:hypothetical protein D3C71_1871750 [compost metagenome]